MNNLHRWINTILIITVGYMLYVSSCEKDVEQCEFILMEELRG